MGLVAWFAFCWERRGRNTLKAVFFWWWMQLFLILESLVWITVFFFKSKVHMIHCNAILSYSFDFFFKALYFVLYFCDSYLFFANPEDQIAILASCIWCYETETICLVVCLWRSAWYLVIQGSLVLRSTAVCVSYLSYLSPWWALFPIVNRNFYVCGLQLCVYYCLWSRLDIVFSI